MSPLSSDVSLARLAALRARMAEHNLAAYLVDSADSHQNEYVAAADERRVRLPLPSSSGGTHRFSLYRPGSVDLRARREQQSSCKSTLSSGRTAVTIRSVQTSHFPFFFCSTSPFLSPLTLFLTPSPLQQATQQLSPSWTLQAHGAPGVPSWTDWLTTPSHSSSLLPRGSRVGLDPALLSIADYTALSPALHTAGVELVPIRENLVDSVWEKGQGEVISEGGARPQRPKNEVFVLEDKYAGESAKAKIARVRKDLEKEGVFGSDKRAVGKRCWGVVLSQLDEIAWLLNLRGTDIPFNPVFFSHLVLPTSSSSKPTLFIDLDQVPQKTYEYLSATLDVHLEPYDSLNAFLEGVSKVVSEDVRFFPFPFPFPAFPPC